MKQLEGLFDVPEAKRATLALDMDVPLDAHVWNVGLVVGPSGAGKSTAARALFPDAIVSGYEWDRERSLLDAFDAALGIREITAALSSVGFNSPPAWLKPFHVLSNGEQFRATMARTFVDPRPLIVMDEFTSVVDRTVARIGASAIGKAVRRANKQFVAISCHEDVVEWLCPDWILEPHAGRFAWRLLQRRPNIDLDICRISRAHWGLFAPHHYMTGALNQSATCFGAYYHGRLVAFSAWLPFVGSLRSGKRGRRNHRTVCLPDFQGVGIGAAIADTIAAMWSGLGFEALSRASHPAVMRAHIRSPLWKQTGFGFSSLDGGLLKGPTNARTHRRRALSSIYVGPPMQHENALALLESRPQPKREKTIEMLNVERPNATV